MSKVMLEPISSVADDTSQLLSVEKGLVDFAQLLTHLADLRDWEATKLDALILGEVTQYDQVCKAIREEVKINASIRGKEVLRRRATEQKRNSTVLRADNDFEKIIEDFEEQKNKDLKSLMLNFVKIQLKLHMDSVNQLTQVYQRIQDIDCTEDAIKFKEDTLKLTANDPKQTMSSKLIKSRSQSMGALNNIMHPSNPFRRLTVHSKQSLLNRSEENVVDDSVRGKQLTDESRPRISINSDESAAEDELTNSEEEQDDETTDQEEKKPRRTHLKIPTYK